MDPWSRWTLAQTGSWRQDTIHTCSCNSCESWKTSVWSLSCNMCTDRLWHYQQIWHESCWHQSPACSVLEGLWEGTFGCVGLCAERWEVPGTSAAQREPWHWKDGSFTFQLVYHHRKSTTTLTFPQLVMLQKLIFREHSMQPTCKSIAWETFHWTHKTMDLPWKANVSS